jgi:SAM-dependent methyltransferase
MQARPDRKIDTRAVGLDVGLSLARWLTGGEHLHYGLWDGLEPNAGNLGAAQEAYTRHLLGYLPEGAGLRVLDVGGGAGETAARLLALGHTVEIVVPSPLLAERCRENAPAATVYETGLEGFGGAGPFDLVLFSESFQYVPLADALAACARLTEPGGHVLIADVFRSADYEGVRRGQTVGGGHRLAAFRTALAEAPLEIEAEEDITARVAPSIDIEQGLFNVVGDAVRRVDAELARSRPLVRRLLVGGLRLSLSARRRERLATRLFERTRTAEAFYRYNRYMIFRLRRT